MMTVKPSEIAREAPAPSLLYMYLWPFWMFRDAHEGSLFERAAAYRHNRAQRVYLPGYVFKWSVVFAVLLAAISLFEKMAGAYWAFEQCCTLLAAASGILASLALVVIVVISVAYVFLGRWQS